VTVYPFDPKTHARTTDPDTSHEAARKLRPGSMIRVCLRAFADGGPMTADELVAFLGYDPTWAVQSTRGAGAWRRASDLAALGYVVDTGERRPSFHSGRNQIVRAITDAGREALSRDN
jgi:hypothetical protein